MKKVKAKKHLGQHFLKDLSIAEDIAKAITGHGGAQTILEIGPGMGVLTDFLLELDQELLLIDIDKESIAFLSEKYLQLAGKIIYGDFLDYDFREMLPDPYIVAGNFPYNISTQIFFRILEQRHKVTEVVCMLQKEVAERIASPKGNKSYGILSVLLQAFYDIEYLFSVPPHVFDPPPKVNSGVIRLLRNSVEKLDCDEKLFFKVVKGGFGNRRKTLRNSLKSFDLADDLKQHPLMDLRAEQLSVDDFVFLTSQIEKSRGNN
ncbi:16S rRNA (adenine(1518)-N(6)/adenine(1519)-N(6))-dimethyltransferase RsmA [Algoriphagus sediminis]|uniref:Ribosomal RNA small subunit methyltransferase A n=1 Tax=Algoriphagus sediminis TaxID=3057113 RepID=A0ABT7YAG6_9BACT|nr:16S rRNA (adenine(1518)-N(6)/adenine(1519)-N(6))-dimethyltransferase RsmA [Algoriphagus sediminis]MDN3203511.1 16S rRNA (adenine(1518)-N(6)/adenine(1519)-N(6))-dimethyltransferase RsmA [Algoriphagus sediminis]